MAGKGQREANKLKRMQDIVSAAAGLFAERGYEQTKIEDIAAAAGVSPATVYNHFGTKGAILTAVAGRDLESVLGAAEEAFDPSASSAVDVLMPVIDVYIGFTVGLGKDLLKEILRAGFDPAASEMLIELVSLDEALVRQIGGLLGRMQEAGLVSRSLDLTAASLLVYSVLAGAMIWFVSVPEMEPAGVRAHLRTQLAIVFDGIAAK
ncbi:MAG: TetR/AcrR family transcriptional regulator [Actinomycetota bacterium]